MNLSGQQMTYDEVLTSADNLFKESNNMRQTLGSMNALMRKFQQTLKSQAGDMLIAKWDAVVPKLETYPAKVDEFGNGLRASVEVYKQLDSDSVGRIG